MSFQLFVPLIVLFLAVQSSAEERKHLLPIAKPYLQCFTLNKAGEPTAYRLTALDPKAEGEYILDVNIPVLFAGPYEAAVAMSHDFEIVTLKMTDTSRNISMTTYNLKVRKGESLKAMFNPGEPELPPQFLDCSVKDY